MQSDAIAFGIEDQRAKAVRADLAFWLEHFSAVGAGSLDGLIQATFHR